MNNNKNNWLVNKYKDDMFTIKAGVILIIGFIGAVGMVIWIGVLGLYFSAR